MSHVNAPAAEDGVVFIGITSEQASVGGHGTCYMASCLLLTHLLVRSESGSFCPFDG